MRFTQIKFNGLYNLKDVDLDLSSGSALIVGPNGSGKTNIIKALQWILEKHAKTDPLVQDNLQSIKKAVKDESSGKYAEIHAGLSGRETRIVCKFRAIFVTFVVARFVSSFQSLSISYLNNITKSIHNHERDAGIFKNIPEEVFNELFSWKEVKTTETLFMKKLVERFAVELHPKLLAIAEDSCNRNSTYGTSDAVWKTQYSRIDESWETSSFSFTENLKLPFDSAKEVVVIRCFLQSFLGPDIEKMLRFSDGDHRNERTLSEVITSWIQLHALMRGIEPLAISFKMPTQIRCEFIFSEHEGVIRQKIRENVGFYMSIKKVMGTLLSRDFDVIREMSLIYSAPHGLLTTFLNNCPEKSLCILPQDRGLSEGENVRWAISLKNVEQQLIKWKLSNNTTRKSRYVEVQKALKSMTGLEVDVVYLDDDGEQLMENKNPPLRLQLRKNKESDGFLVSELSGGEKECLMVLTATQLENADTVFLDEPGHSLHPPQQAQLRRWLETQRRPDQVIAIVSHAVEFISPVSLRSLYHMSDTGEGFTPFRLAISDNSSSEAVTNAHGEVKPMTTAGPSGQDIQVSSEDEESNTVNLSQGAITMLMSPDMRKMFFATGVYFVEGETDKRFLSALRYFMLEHARRIRETSENSRDLLQAQMILEMDSWDILVLGGCANALKAYRAAKELKIPCAVVLDEDTITVKHGKRMEPFTQANWEKSRLCRELKKNEKSINAASTILQEMQSAFNHSEFGAVGKKAREILEKHGFWVWRGDLEHLVLDNQDVRQGIKQTDVIVDFIAEELSCKLTIGEWAHRSSDDSMKNFDEKIRDPLTLKLEELQDELEASREARLEDPSSPVTVNLQRILNEIGHYQQKAKQHDRYCQGTGKRSSESGEPLGKAPRISPEGETSHARIQEEAFWKRVKEKLHDDGGWMKMPWEVMQQIIALCLKDEKGHLAEFCRFMKRHQYQGRSEKNEVPEDIISKILTNARNPVEEKATECSPVDMGE